MLKKYFILLISFFISGNIFSQTLSKPFAVVELFTSEGCSSCPPADKVLSDIIINAEKNHKNIFCLEYHVDYWNRKGWKDPFSKRQFSNRQNNYSDVLPEKTIYTPQMIVNGETEFTGSYADKANAAISKALKTPAVVDLKFKIDSTVHDTIYISYQSSKADKNYFLRFAVVEKGLSANVAKGENSGKTLKHENVVRSLKTFDLNEKTGTAKIPVHDFKFNKRCIVIGFVQHKQTYKILGAAG